ncbi:hypothetical protein SPBR_08886 [Sporothrix brasiliensis 5110]|uniref:Uncharacterized protein n=1 Tax=Sporothrix brasiliensis 5110 TaxID=1398154 RepID=A0A0C2INZ0_9PEZI|nr:uncharacterized protein SPBR_08886 [Sporothrix brasiliensis 5110]KIH86787.1 hypothetical protein SPBR_08886 [Sporothrix brasiliensis 5110]
MATNDGFPTRESVLLAMRNDLGMTRVDDLQLENGHRGHTIRTGNASSIITAQATAAPRKILPVASKWKSAIQSGAFDDDDAETVKGLDRIGGGRLHALNNAPTVPAQYFPQRKRLPPGLPPPGLRRNTPFNIQPEPHRPAKSVPEPASFVYKEAIRVADRLAKGEGVVYLVALSDSDPGTFHIYLEGSKYLEYPVVKMHNYITNSTDLCPQFKESDGVSITTTRLVFGSQDKIAQFMEVLRGLKARKQEHGSEATTAIPVIEPMTEPDTELSATNHSEHPSLPAEKAPDEAIHRPQGDAFAEDDAMGSKINLQDSLLEILPKFEAMVRILDSVEEAKREDTAKLVFSSLRSSLDGKTNVHLSSAEQLLRAILAKLSKEKGTSAKAADTVCRLRYTRDNIERLRDHAAPPPEILDKLDFLPRPSRLGRPKASRRQPLHTPSSSLTDSKTRSNLKPTAEPFQPSPPPKMRQTKSTDRLTLTGSILGMQPATTSPVALSDISNSSISSNIDSLTARMSRLTLPDAQSKTATKGLQGSRWATAGNSVSTENANRFMGIAIPP